MSSVAEQRAHHPLLAVLRRLAAGSLIGLALAHGFPPQAWRVLGPVLAHVPQVGSRLHLLLLPSLLLLLLEAAALPAGVLLLLWEVVLPGPHEHLWRQQSGSPPTEEAGEPASKPPGSAAPTGTAAAGEAQDALRAAPAAPPLRLREEAEPFAVHLALAASPPGEERETMVVGQQGDWSLSALLEAGQPAACLLAKTTLMQQLPALLTAPTHIERVNEALLSCLQRVQEQLLQRAGAGAPPLHEEPAAWCVLISALVCQGKEQRGVLALLGPRAPAGTPLTLVPLRVEWQAGRWRGVPEQAGASPVLAELALVEAASLGALLDTLRQALLAAGASQQRTFVLLLRLLADMEPA